MDALLVLALLAAALTGGIVTRRWLQRPESGSEARTYWHGGATALVLMVFLLGLDHQAPGAGLRLAAVFFSIATGMLLFLQRQRQRRFSNALLGTHIAVALAALILTGARLV